MDMAQHRLIGPLAQRMREITKNPRHVLHHGLRPHEDVGVGTRFLLGAYVLARMVRSSDITEKAGATAYSFVFSLIPLVTTTLALFTAIPGLESERENL